MPIESYSDCGTVKQPSLNTATQHAGSVPTARPGISKRQSGGGVAKNAGTLVNMKADATAGPCKNCGGTPYYGYSKAIPGVNNYPTFSGLDIIYILSNYFFSICRISFLKLILDFFAIVKGTHL